MNNFAFRMDCSNEFAAPMSASVYELAVAQAGDDQVDLSSAMVDLP